MDTYKIGMLRNHVSTMSRSGIGNYIAPGLESWLLGGEGKGLVRMFKATRSSNEFITPHSHRFDFVCMVLSGRVVNTVYEETDNQREDSWVRSLITRPLGGDRDNLFVNIEDEPRNYMAVSSEYDAGDIYAMRAEEIHSILFAEGTCVLFFEGPEVSPGSFILEPFVNGARVPTFKVEDWMYTKLEGM